MNRKECLAILDADKVTQDKIESLASYMHIRRNEPDSFDLDGDFTLDQLRAIIWWFENPQEFCYDH